MTEEIKKILDFHADDYGISKNSCNEIISLLQNGYLNSISILPNMSTFGYAVDMLKKFNAENPDKIPLVTVHLNFMEGHCCAPVEKVPDLVDEKGYFKISWGTLFKWNYNPFARCRIMRQLETEIIAQTEKCIAAGIVPKDNLRFDGHQHTHMIPLVFHALLNACVHFEKSGCKTTFIRNTQDPILPYFKAKDTDKKLRRSFEKINIIKCLILNFYSKWVVRPALKKLALPAPYLCGVFFSGHMDSDRLEKILPFYCARPIFQNRTVELLFHPGSVVEVEICEEFVKPDFNLFHLSEGRKIEYNSICNLNK